jgi:hypothetical protein
MPEILATQKAEIRRIVVQSHPRQMFSRPYLKKKLSQNMAGGVTQVAEHLPSKHQALRSIPQCCQKQIKNKTKQNTPNTQVFSPSLLVNMQH